MAQRHLPLLALRPFKLSGSNDKRTRFLDNMCQACEKFGSESIGAVGNPVPCPQEEHYIVKDPREAYWRVMVSNPSADKRPNSVVGETGHLERANAWTHLIAAFTFAAYAVVRAGIVDTHTVASHFSAVSIVMSSLTFAISTIYHVYNTVPGCAAFVRNLDIASIYASLGVAAIADTALVTNNFYHVPAQTLADPLLAAFCLGAYFGVRRVLVPSTETREFMYQDQCSIGLFRVWHSDLEHSGLRLAGVGSLTLVWIQLVPAAAANLNRDAAAVWLIGVTVATMLLVVGVVFDNYYIVDDAVKDGTKCMGCFNTCSSKRMGCVMNSHAWWHILSFLGTVVVVIAREYGVMTLPHLTR